MSEAGTEVAQAARAPAGEQEGAQVEEGGASKTTFSGTGDMPPVAPRTQQATPSASDQAFGETSELPESGSPQARFRGAVAKRGPVAITIAGEAPTAIGALLTKEPTLAATYFEVVAANRADTYRDPLAALFPNLNLANKKKLFAAQFGFEIVERPRTGNPEWSPGEFHADQIDKMYAAAQLLPPGHLADNPRFKKLEAGVGATFHDKQDTIVMPSYGEASKGESGKQYNKAFCHEVGHAVDFALGEQTDALRKEFGWHVVKPNNDDANLAAHFDDLGVLSTELTSEERLILVSAMAGAIGVGDDYMPLHLQTFNGYDAAKSADLIKRGLTPQWKERRKAFSPTGMTIGDQQYFAAGFAQQGWAYKVPKATYDAVPEMGKVSHYEWFAEWYATYYTQPNHGAMPDRLREFFDDVVEPFNSQRSALGAADTTEGTGGETPRHV